MRPVTDEDTTENDRCIAARVSVPTAIHPDDMLFQFVLSAFGNETDALRYYFEDGANSAQKFSELTNRFLSRSGATVLEFASGYGRVTRHLVRYDYRLTASDIHREANAFNREAFGVTTIQSSDTPEEFKSGKFDAIFALSFFSHMPRATWGRWLTALHDRLNEGGVLVFTTHGEESFRRARPDNTGYWFEPASEQRDLDQHTYGLTVTTRPFVDAQISTLTDVEFLNYEPSGWWGHQDVYVIRRRTASAYVPVLPSWFGKPDYFLPFSIVAHQVKRLASHLRTGRF